jgi:general secretion pathway protein D
MTLRAIALVIVAVMLAGCAGDIAFNRGEKFSLEGDWDRAVIEYRQASREDPENIEYKTRLAEALDMAATRHIERANHYIREDNPEAALYEAEQAQNYSPGNNKAEQLIKQATLNTEIKRRMTTGKNFLAAGRLNEALNQFYYVLDLDRKNKEAKDLIEDVTKRRVSIDENPDELSLASDQPITLSFKETKIKEVFEFLAKLAGINILFDEDVKNTNVTVFAKDMSFNQALSLLLATNKLFYKKVSDDTIIIIPKTKSKQAQYQDLMMKTFYLSNTKAKDMVNILRSMLETRKIITNDTLNSVTLRETPEKIALAEKIIEANDKKDAEVVIDVQVLAVDRTDNMTYGVNLPKGVEGTYAPGGVAPGSGTGGVFSNVITNISNFKEGYTSENYKDNVWFQYPSVTVDWSQSRSHAETLTNPKIRTLNNQPAKILIGSRIPVQTGTVNTGVTGGVTTSFEYREIGIKLNVEPNISLSNDVTLKTQVEVSSLGDNVDVGQGVTLPRINTTSVEATLNLRDGETVIIGGLLENLTSKNISGIAGLMDTPILGKIFSTNTIGPDSKRELIITLTPHVVRSMEIPRRDVTEFWSGTEDDYSATPVFEVEKKRPYSEYDRPMKKYEMPIALPGKAETPAAAAPAETPAEAPAGTPAVTPETPAGTTTGETPAAKPETPAPQGQPAQPAAQPGTQGASAAPGTQPEYTPYPDVPYKKIGRVGKLGFAPDVTPLVVGQTVTVEVMAEDMDNLYEAPLSIIYNPKLVEFVEAKEGTLMNSDGAPTSFTVSNNDKVGYINISVVRLGKVPGISASGPLYSLTFKGKAPGICPLVFKQNSLLDTHRNTVSADLRTGTLFVK